MNSSPLLRTKNETFVVTQVHRQTRCFMSWLVVTKRDAATLQPIVDDAPMAFQYCTDGLTAYALLNYHQGLHLVAEGKSQTYSVKGGNADLRHYLARLAKKSSCFSRSIAALRRAITFFLDCYCWNKRQLYRRRYPAYTPCLVRLRIYLGLNTPKKV